MEKKQQSAFDIFYNELSSFIGDYDDPERAHIVADGLLKDIAIQATLANLTVFEVNELIKVYDKIRKWYS